MKTAREVLKKLYESAFENSVKSSYMMEQNPYGIDSALSDLSEIVMSSEDKSRDRNWNHAVYHIAKLFLDKEQTK